MNKRSKLSILIMASIFSTAVYSTERNIGVNVTNIFLLPIEEQERTIQAISDAHVKSIRTSIPNTKDGIEFARRIQKNNIKIHLIIRLDESIPSSTPRREYDRANFPRVWPSPPLSSLDPNYFRSFFRKKLTELSGAGIQISAFEIFNEINTAAFNADFPVPGEGRQLGYADLTTSDTGIKVAKGFDRYIEILKIAKEELQASQNYKNTPLISAGLGGIEAPEGKLDKINTDLISINATIKYLNQHGANNYVDGYGVHVYPWENGPGNPTEAVRRKERLDRYVLTNCGKLANSPPCWITEWGFKADSASCPVEDKKRLLLVDETRKTFETYMRNGQVSAIYYYTWNSDPLSPRNNDENRLAAYLCNRLTESGKRAIED
ncbi:MAG: hypothetical protein JSR83_00225 [Proteobacteria bacterium]|nr:hypothetical protein [Pseudomonadota bacterium]